MEAIVIDEHGTSLCQTLEIASVQHELPRWCSDHFLSIRALWHKLGGLETDLPCMGNSSNHRWPHLSSLLQALSLTLMMFPLKPYDQLSDPQRLWFLSVAMTDLGLAQKVGCRCGEGT